MDWSFLTSREQSELKLAQVYVEHFDHGTDGHNRLTLIHKLAKRLVELSGELEKSKNEDTEQFMD